MNIPDPLTVKQVNAENINANQMIVGSISGVNGGAAINASKINLGGWIFESKDDGVYVTTPTGIQTKMELIDFRQVPVPQTVDLLNYNPRTSVTYQEIPGGPQQTPGGQLGHGNATGGGGAIGSGIGIPGAPFVADTANKILPGADGVGFQAITNAAIAKLPPSMNNTDFINSLNNISQVKNVSANSLLSVMQIQSGFTSVDQIGKGFGAINQFTGASGLMQIMPDAAKSLGYSIDQIKNMSAVEQMTGPITSYMNHLTLPQIPSVTDLYMANFYPAAIGKLDSFVLGNIPGAGTVSSIATANPVFKGVDGTVSVGSVKNWLQQNYPTA
jgi:hypothetical protein